MHKKLKQDIKNINKIFAAKFLDKVSKKTGFVKRSGKITTETFLALNVFSGEDLCKKSLSELCGRLDVQYNIQVSPQALNERFNEDSVKFMQEIFNSLMLQQNNTICTKHKELFFNRILVNDSTSYGLPEKFYNEFKGTGGSGSKSAVKIQLQYDLLSGNFLCCDVFSGTESDGKYLDTMDEHTQEGDLRLADLGYFKIEYLRKINDRGAFFISKLKSNSMVYMKNPNPKIRPNGEIFKSTEYIKINIFELVEPLADGETIELKDIYIGSKKELKTRLIISKLSEENKKKREIKHLKAVNKERGTINDRSIAWNCINAYITNVPDTILSKEEIHDVYSLRWQVEIMFKIWKSIFNIDNVKPVKLERFKCFLYGRLISVLFSSIIVSTAKDIIYEEDSNEISEIKSFYHITEFFNILRIEIFKGELAISKLFKRILNVIRKLGIKSKKKGKKTINQILKYMKISSNDLVSMVV